MTSYSEAILMIPQRDMILIMRDKVANQSAGRIEPEPELEPEPSSY